MIQELSAGRLGGGRSVAAGDFGQEFSVGFGQVKCESEGLAGGAYFLDSFTKNVGGLVVALLVSEVGEAGFKEHQAEGVLESLDLGIAAEVALADDVADAVGGGVVVAGFAENAGGFGGVELMQSGSPAQIAAAAFGLGIAGDAPALQVMGAGGEEKLGAGLGVEAADPVGHEAGVGKFAGNDLVADLDRVRILAIEVVDEVDGAVKAGIGGHGDGLSWGPVAIVAR